MFEWERPAGKRREAETRAEPCHRASLRLSPGEGEAGRNERLSFCKRLSGICTATSSLDRGLAKELRGCTLSTTLDGAKPAAPPLLRTKERLHGSSPRAHNTQIPHSPETGVLTVDSTVPLGAWGRGRPSPWRTERLGTAAGRGQGPHRGPGAPGQYPGSWVLQVTTQDATKGKRPICSRSPGRSRPTAILLCVPLRFCKMAPFSKAKESTLSYPQASKGTGGPGTPSSGRSVVPTLQVRCCHGQLFSRSQRLKDQGAELRHPDGARQHHQEGRRELS